MIDEHGTPFIGGPLDGATDSRPIGGARYIHQVLSPDENRIVDHEYERHPDAWRYKGVRKVIPA